MTQAVAQTASTVSFTDLVAEELRAQLGRKRVSGRELARRLNVSNQWTSQRTRGVVALNTAEMEAIASCLGITVGELLAGAIARASGPSDGSSITAR
ncbi:helix-turn-helix domain-containing protein [Pseudonocardia dioxanivorans]|uniref:helix-turn-helix domain-containing protein n=1 Tax=Pseudonocardia dioxanivorans TaxID=240495 RepID=UPI0005A28E88|nr:helix-turn-helix transcriptional regulator [Pseudonocardia dioxanivorans]